MKFKDLAEKEEPANEVFEIALGSVYDEDDGNTENIDRLSPESKLVYLLWSLDNEVHNGGFSQLFTNSLGNHCHEILHYLEQIKAINSHRLLQTAMSYFPDSTVPKSRQKRCEIWQPISEIKQVEDALDELDSEYFRYEDNLGSILNNYVLENPEAQILV